MSTTKNKRFLFAHFNNSTFFTDGKFDVEKSKAAYSAWVSNPENIEKLNLLEAATAGDADVWENQGESVSEQIQRIFGERASAVATYLTEELGGYRNSDDVISDIAGKDVGAIGGQFAKQFVTANKSDKEGATTLLVSKRSKGGGTMLNPVYRKELLGLTQDEVSVSEDSE